MRPFSKFTERQMKRRREGLKQEEDPMFPGLKGDSGMIISYGDRTYVVARIWDGEYYNTEILGPYTFTGTKKRRGKRMRLR